MEIGKSVTTRLIKHERIRNIHFEIENEIYLVKLTHMYIRDLVRNSVMFPMWDTVIGMVVRPIYLKTRNTI